MTLLYYQYQLIILLRRVASQNQKRYIDAYSRRILGFLINLSNRI